MEAEATPDYEVLPPRTLPPAPAADKHQLLLVDIAGLTNSEAAQVVNYLRECIKDEDGNGPTASVQLWRPPRSAFIRPLRDKHQDVLKRHYKDSKANLYGLAVLAYRAGYRCSFLQTII
ncbi:hypothetical protein BDW71DRAFT_206970 [Aspergillus fruticulosus]